MSNKCRQSCRLRAQLNPTSLAQEGGIGLPATVVYNPGTGNKKHIGPTDAKGLVEMAE